MELLNTRVQGNACLGTTGYQTTIPEPDMGDLLLGCYQWGSKDLPNKQCCCSLLPHKT